MTVTDTSISSFEVEYNEIMKGFNKENLPFQTEEVKTPNDVFVKFSLYVESPLVITSTNTSINKKP